MKECIVDSLRWKACEKVCRIYRIYLFVIVVCSWFVWFPAKAEVYTEVITNRVVQEKGLLNAFRDTEYRNMELLQPEDIEKSIDVTESSSFAEFAYFPVVAMNENKAILILLRRIGNQWEIDTVNEDALNREGLRLAGFLIESNYSKVDGNMNVYFDFLDSGNNKLCLHLQVNKRRGGEFKALTGVYSREGSCFFADSWSVAINGSYIFTYDYIMPSMRREYKIGMYSAENDAKTFSLRKMPLSIYEIMKTNAVRINRDSKKEKIEVKELPDHRAVTICELVDGQEILCENGDMGYEFQEWILVICDGRLGYVHKSYLEI